MASFGYAVEGFPVSSQQVARIEKEAGLTADVVVFYLQWPAPEQTANGVLPGPAIRGISEAGALPCITWEPMCIVSGREWMLPAQSVCGGDYDGYLRAFAADVAAARTPVLIRFAHEMNLSRYHWGSAADAYGPDSPPAYRAMFRHVVETCRRAGATNALWVFCPNAESVPGPAHDASAAWNVVSNYYPGHEFVDVLGVDGYNWGTNRTKALHGWDSHPRSFEDIFAGSVAELRAMAPDKPIFVFETASVGTAAEKWRWLDAAVDYGRRQGLAGLAWFQVNKEEDWTLEAEPAAAVQSRFLQIWQAGLNASRRRNAGQLLRGNRTLADDGRLP